ncbi:MAG TPA: hypothetical protein VFQ45_00180 [Longimicrobium sp.]|nr:hypothetical protein [Longimicrobium sp.]
MSTAAITMDAPASPRAPAWGAIAAEQVRAVGLGLRVELTLLALFLAGLTVLLNVTAYRTGERINTDIPNVAIPLFMLALAAPLAIWKGEEPARRGYLWAMPVPRVEHSLAKVFAGWVWVMGIVVVMLLWVLAMAWATGGDLRLDRSLGMLDGMPRGARVVAPAMEGYPWMWLVPFTGATVAYLAGSILALASNYPWRWIAGGVFAFMMTAMLMEMGGLMIEELVEDVFRAAATVMLGTSDTVVSYVDARGAPLRAIQSAPDAARWAVSSLVALALALAGVLAAARRGEER